MGVARTRLKSVQAYPTGTSASLIGLYGPGSSRTTKVSSPYVVFLCESNLTLRHSLRSFGRVRLLNINFTHRPSTHSLRLFVRRSSTVPLKTSGLDATSFLPSTVTNSPLHPTLGLISPPFVTRYKPTLTPPDPRT